jgi:hypothetical protein
MERSGLTFGRQTTQEFGLGQKNIQSTGARWFIVFFELMDVLFSLAAVSGPTVEYSL